MARPKGWAKEEKKKAFTLAVKTAGMEAGLKQKELGEIIGVHPARISQLINHPDDITADRLRILVETLDLPLITVAEFLGYTKKQIENELKHLRKDQNNEA